MGAREGGLRERKGERWERKREGGMGGERRGSERGREDGGRRRESRRDPSTLIK